MSIKITPEMVNAISLLTAEAQKQYEQAGHPLTVVHLCGVLYPVREGQMTREARPTIVNTVDNDPNIVLLTGSVLHSVALDRLAQEQGDDNVH